MKKPIHFIIVLLIQLASQAQNRPVSTQPVKALPVALPPAYVSNATNYVKTWTPSMPATDMTAVKAGAATVMAVRQQTQYFDGLGRTLQTVDRGVSPMGRDLVQPTVYDHLGRERYKYLPYVAKNGNAADGTFKLSPFTAQRDFYRDSNLIPGIGADSIYYAQVAYEAAPPGRVLQTWEAGNAWAKEGGNHPVRQQYLVNSGSDAVRVWEFATDAVIPVSTRVYDEGSLFKEIITDADGTQTITFSDQRERILLKKVQLLASPGLAHAGWLCTYYAYDVTGALRCVIPPKAVEAISSNWMISSTIASELCFMYRYDARQRMIVQKIPGADSVEMVYDRRDRLIARRDGIMKTMGLWHAAYYDALDRERRTALVYTTESRAALQARIDLRTFDPTEGITTGTNLKSRDLSYTYYDDYNFPGRQSYNTTGISKVQAGANAYAEPLPLTPATMTKELMTGKRVRVEAGDQFITTTYYYNNKGRVIQTIADNMTGGTDITNTLYDFSGKILSTYEQHTNPQSVLTPQTTVLTMFDYDAMGRVDTLKKRINDDPALQRTIAVNTYDELGRLKTKRLDVTGAATQLETQQYEYNIHGWMRAINKQFVNGTGSDAAWFGQEYCYESGFDNTGYDGNIAGVKWKSLGDGISRAYGYSYDNAGRLLSADFTQQNTAGATWTNNKVNFSASMTYDAGGNILFMRQQGMSGTAIKTIDSLKYGYFSNSNRLSYVTDRRNDPASLLGDFKETDNREVQDYWYDPNGNIAKDKNKQIDTVLYNYQQLPAILLAKNRKASIYYLYAAGTGLKLAKMVSDTSVRPYQFRLTHYMGDLLYEQDTLQSINHEEGRIRPVYVAGSPVTYAFDYYVKDNLGNVRMVLTTERNVTLYRATMEGSVSATENALFSNIDNTRTVKPANYPVDNTTSQNDCVARLNAENGQKIGPSLVLRVTAGDSIQAGIRAFYRDAAANKPATTTEDMLAALLQTFGSNSLSKGVHHVIDNSAPLAALGSAQYQQLKSKDPGQDLPDKPRAYLNFVTFDDAFNLVEENTGTRQVQGDPDALQSLVIPPMRIRKNGYLYIYTSNESARDVFFDNLTVTHNGGTLLEETHYYPYGLTMAGISTNALKGPRYPENRKKYNGIEFSTDLGLDQYDAFYRTLDPQIGRWRQPDPKIDQMEAWSPYASNFDNPVRYSDLLGDWPGPSIDGLFLRVLKFASEAKENFKSNTRAQAGLVKKLAAQGVQNFRDRVATGTTTPQLIFNDFRKNPLAAITGAAGMELKVATVATEELALTAKVGNGAKVVERLEATVQMKAKLDGAGRAALFGPDWPKASLKEAIEKFAPGAKGMPNDLGDKMLFLNEKTKIQVVYDHGGDYFRIENLNLPGKRVYVDLEGKVPNNKIVNGKQKGRTEGEYHQVTHYKNTDPE